MPGPEEHSATVRAAYEGMAGGNPQALLGVLHPEIEIHEPPNLPHGGSFRGQEEVLGMFQKAAAVMDPSRLEIESLVAEGDHVVALIRIGLQAGGDALLCEHWRFEDGKARELRVFWFDSSAAA